MVRDCLNDSVASYTRHRTAPKSPTCRGLRSCPASTCTRAHHPHPRALTLEPNLRLLSNAHHSFLQMQTLETNPRSRKYMHATNRGSNEQWPTERQALAPEKGRLRKCKTRCALLGTGPAAAPEPPPSALRQPPPHKQPSLPPTPLRIQAEKAPAASATSARQPHSPATTHGPNSKGVGNAIKGAARPQDSVLIWVETEERPLARARLTTQVRS
jgi:hypothetical protein